MKVLKATIIKRTDSMSEINKKLKKGGSIKFQKGTYRISKQLVIPSETVINLNGATLKRCANIQSVFINTVDNDTTAYSGASNITIKNGTIEGMGGYSYDNLITFFHAQNIKIIEVTFKDSLCHAIELNSCYDVSINKCKFLGYNLESTDYTYRELIQIDYAGAGAFFLSGSSTMSACYDGTVCRNIRIFDCVFNKSEYRDYPYACIGTHAQLYKGKQHDNIKIYNNEFYCKHNSIKQPCLSLIQMSNVIVENNVFDCDVVARIYSKTQSYIEHSTIKVPYAKGDGWCNKITINDNIISCSSSRAFKQSNKTKKTHTNIVKKNNKFNQEV